MNVYSPDNLAIAVQCFNKPDTTIQCLETLAGMDGIGAARLLVYQDGVEGNRRAEGFREAHADTARQVAAWLEEKGGLFRSAVFHGQERNMGTCKTTQNAIDMAFGLGEWVLFTEDDVLFEPDALNWFETAINAPVFAGNRDIWAVAGESKAFDSRGGEVSDRLVEDARRLVVENELIDKCTLMAFLPSSCFATVSDRWAEFGETRGLPHGDRDVNIRCREEGKRSLWPVVARCRDVGMHHPLGYSVAIKKGDLGTIPNKSVYLASGDVGGRIDRIDFLPKPLNRVFRHWTGETLT